ncbi:glycosyl hydrolase family 3 N terminal domain-containing protein [Lipomyces arxii]|uniref:glycosyl hydrolase family 3 N terminal domain-containing protein n=1 Tax=Lipomyces arxii TaxID=56418 RepID=UPI0034CD5688
MKTYGLLCALIGFFLLSCLHTQAAIDGLSPPVYPSPMGGMINGEWQAAYARARELVKGLTLVEKINITTGTGWMMGPCVGNTGEIPRVGFPSLCLQDSPTGIRMTDFNSVFPAGLSVAATFNKNLMYLRGRAMGQENRAKGINAILGPCLGPIGRAPEGGRNWEAFGSDPYLQGVASFQTVQGIQEEGVMATAKHYILNEQEHFRQQLPWVEQFGFRNLTDAYSSNVDERALREIYVWPFADAVRAGAASVMCSYNQANGSQACQNSYLLNGVLKDELGFQGFVMSDWGGQRSGVASVLAGLDMSMPGDGVAFGVGNSIIGANLTIAVLNGSVPLWRVDDMATRIVASYFKVGQDSPTYPEPNFSSWTFADQGPLIAGAAMSNDSRVPVGTVNYHVDARGSLSSQVVREVATESIVLVKNTRNALPLRAKSLALIGSAAGPAEDGPNACPDRGCNNGTLGTGWGSGSANFPYLVSALDAITPEAIQRGITLDFHLEDYNVNPSMAALADAAIVFITSDAGEGYISVEGNIGDRNNLYPWYNGTDLVKAVAAVNNNTIVVIESVGQVDMEPWIEHTNVTAVMYALVAGQDVGYAISDVLFGNVSPSGKLPFTIAKNLSDYPATVMYRPNADAPQINFTESIYIDYRHFDKYDITPRYEFGYGLSYATFDIGGFTMNHAFGAITTETPPMAPPYLKSFFMDDKVPSPESVVYPDDIPRYRDFLYPYLTNWTADSIEYDRTAYPYPAGYSEDQPEAPSPAGGGSGGNPALWDVLVQIQAKVTNTGSVGGAEVVQLYVSYPEVEGVEFPVRAFRGFEKVGLSPGESATVNFDLMRRDLSYFDSVSRNYLLPRGKYTYWIGNSSRNVVDAGSFYF